MAGVLVRIPEPAVQEVLPLPHLAWADLGEERATALARDTRSLLLRFWSLRSAPPPDREVARGDVARHAAFVAETFGYLGRASPSARAALARWTEGTYVALDHHGDHAPEADPFRDLAEVADPPGHLAPDLAPAWPFLMGRLAHRAEVDLGWRVRRRRVDLRTWCALVGLACLWSRRSFAAARPGLAAFLEAAGQPELVRDGMLAGANLLVSQRAVVAGYLDVRGR